MHPGLSTADLQAFERALGVELPSRLRQALASANGAEWEFARHEGRFVPANVATIPRDELWHHLLLPITDSRGDQPWNPREFIGRYLPLGDDYAGEILLLDLRTGPKFRVLCTKGEGYGRIALYEEIAGSFEEFYEQCLAPAPEPEPPPAAKEVALARIPAPFAQRNIAVKGICHPGVERDLSLWYIPSAVPGSPYRLRYRVDAWDEAAFGSAWLDTNAGPTLLTVENGGFVQTVYKNAIVASEANAALGRGNSFKVLSDRSKQTLGKPHLVIHECAFRNYTQPPVGGAVEFAVIALRGTRIQILKVELQGLADEGAAEAATKHLLGFGFDWFEE